MSKNNQTKIERKINNPTHLLKDFSAFIKEHAVAGMAIGVIVAQTVKDLVDSLVKGIFTPLIKLLVPTSVIGLVFRIGGVDFDIGIILNALVSFLIIMLMLYFVVKKLLKKEELLKQ